jgi:type IV pilus assembly protein PilB
MDLSHNKIDPDALEIVPESVARRHKIMPVALMGNRLIVAFSDIRNVIALDTDLRSGGKELHLVPMLALEEDIADKIDLTYHAKNRS